MNRRSFTSASRRGNAGRLSRIPMHASEPLGFRFFLWAAKNTRAMNQFDYRTAMDAIAEAVMRTSVS
jgi:hypothetical protein